MNNKKINDIYIYILFLLIVAIAYWQVTLLIHNLKWDMIDCYLPWRYFVGDSIQNGIFPLWNPYQNCGYPIFADMRSVWFPEVYIIGVIFGYSNYTFHFLFLFYLSIAGFGMYKITSLFQGNQLVSIVIGISYMLSGFFTAHSQELSTLISGAFIPLTIFYYLKFSINNKIIDVVKCNIFIFLQLTGGYNAISIILFYFLILFFIFYLIKYFVSKDYFSLKKLIYNNLIFGLILLLTTSFFVISYLQSVDYVPRFNGLSIEKTANYAFTPHSLISLLIPFSSVKNPEFFQTDISMTNLYFGVIMLLMLCLSITLKKSKLLYLILFFGIFSFLASFGTHFFVWNYLFYYLPLFSLFRMPSFFSYFSLFCFLIISSLALEKLFNELNKIKIIYYLTYILILFFIFSTIYSFAIIYKSGFHSYTDFIDFNNANLSIYHHSFLQGLIQIIVLSLFLIVYKYLQNKKNRNKIIASLIIFDLLIAVQLNIPYTVTDNNSPVELHKYLSQIPSDYPLPSANPIINNTDNSVSFSPLWRNTNIFSKSISNDGFNSFVLKNYETLNDSFPVLKDSVLKNYIIYLSDEIKPESELTQHCNYSKKSIFVSDSIFKKYKSKNLKTNFDDITNIKSFEPGNIIVRTSTKNTQVLTLLQSDFPGWKVFIDSKQTTHFLSNKLFISTIIPSGDHEIKFSYINKPILISFATSYLFLLILVLYILFYYFTDIYKTKKTQFYASIGLLIIFIFGFTFAFSNNKNKKNTNIENIKYLLHLADKQAKTLGNDSLTICINTNNVEKIKNFIHEDKLMINPTFTRIEKATDFSDINLIVNNVTSKYFCYISTISHYLPEVEEVIYEKFPEVISNKYAKDYCITLFKINNLEKRKLLFESTNTFENKQLNWSYNPEIFDSTISFNGIFSCKLDSQYIYSPTFKAQLKNICQSKHFQINIAGKFKSFNCKKVFIVLEIRRNSKVVTYKSTDISNFFYNNISWFSAFQISENEELMPDDEIVAYIWNSEKHVVHIDDFRIYITDKKDDH